VARRTLFSYTFSNHIMRQCRGVLDVNCGHKITILKQTYKHFLKSSRGPSALADITCCDSPCRQYDDGKDLWKRRV